MKARFFTFIIKKIPFGRDGLDKIHYYHFVQHHNKQLISKYCKEHKILNHKIVKEWYKNIIEDKVNHPIVIEAIEAQMDLSDEFYIKLKSEMKKVFTSYANDAKDLTIVLDFFNVIHNLILPIIDELPFINYNKVINIYTLFDDIIAETEFSTKMIRIYNNILANKLDNDDIDINNNKLNINNLNQCTWKSRKRKYNNKVSDISNIQETSIINSSSKQFKKQSYENKSVHLSRRK